MLMNSNFLFFYGCFGVTCNTFVPNPQLQSFPPLLFSESYIVLHYTLTSMIHFYLIFVKDVKVEVHLFYIRISDYSKPHLLQTNAFISALQNLMLAY